jgi:hypothetical protein
MSNMRTMSIPPFPDRVEIADVAAFANARLAQEFNLSPQASALAGLVFYPVDKDARTSFEFVLGSAPDPLRLNLKGMSRIQYRWLRVDDVFHLYYDMAIGGHQSRRGGATISKAVHLAAKNTKAFGTGEATFWSAWKAFRDVAPLVTATIIIWDNARRVFRDEYLGAFRTHEDAEPITLDQLSPFHITLLMPEFVLAVGRSFEEFALAIGARPDAGLDPEALWRIPKDINVTPVPPPPRNIRAVDKVILNARRAGNRGRRNKPKTEPLFSRPL